MGRKKVFHKRDKPSYKRSFSSSKLAILALSLLFGILILGKLLTLFLSLDRPISLDLNVPKNYTWDQQSSVNVVFGSLNNFKLTVINFQAKDKKAVVLHITDQTYLELPKGFGNWQVGSIYKLGQEEHPAIGSQLLKLSISKLLGLPIDGIIFLVDGKDKLTAEQFIANLHQNSFNRFLYLKDIRSDLTYNEALNFFQDLSHVRVDKIVSLDLAKSDITDSKLLPDSSRVLGVDTIKLDQFVQDKMADNQFGDEAKTVAIFNATNHPGISMLASRIITNLGGNVVLTATTDQSQPKSVVLGESSLTLRRLTQIFAPWCLKTKCANLDPKVQSSRAQINIILGEDYYNLWFQK